MEELLCNGDISTHTSVSIYISMKVVNSCIFSNRGSLYGESKTPGPGAYDATGSYNKTGNYFLSKFRSTNTGSFGHAARRSFSDRFGKKDII